MSDPCSGNAAAAGFPPLFPDSLDWGKVDGLIPAIVQDADSLRVLMLGYMDRNALRATLDTRRVTFYSRSRQQQWTKGETSGHLLDLVGVDTDCDCDALLVLARPRGPTCHLMRESCFEGAPAQEPAAVLAVGEEGVETALAGVAQSDEQLLGEAADLIYHLTVLLHARGLSLVNAVDVLERRHEGAA